MENETLAPKAVFSFWHLLAKQFTYSPVSILMIRLLCSSIPHKAVLGVPLKNGHERIFTCDTFDQQRALTRLIHTMNDEREGLAPSGDDRINIRDAWQVLWWCRSLNITKTQLEAAIDEVGSEPEDVRRYISSKH